MSHERTAWGARRARAGWATAMAIALALAGCERERSEPAPGAAISTPTPGDSAEASQDAALARASAAADRFAATLRARLTSAIQEGGPASAVRVCHEEAPAIAQQIASETGVTIGRSSLRLRNASNVAPDWVAAWLESTGERPAAQAQGFTRIEGGRARILRPIAVEGPCLLCHGESVAPDVRAMLGERYPGDRATGYRLGDLRGALWAEAEVGGS